MIRASKSVEGLGVLCERSAEDVLTLAEYVKRHENTPTQSIIVCATVVSHSLKEYHKTIKWYKIFHKRKIKKLLNPNHVLTQFSQQQLYSLYMEVLALEGIDFKKKVTETESESAGVPQTL